MKYHIVLKGEKVVAPLSMIGDENKDFWSPGIEALENGVVIVLDTEEKLSGGVFISEDTLLKMEMLIDMQTKENANDGRR